MPSANQGFIKWQDFNATVTRTFREIKEDGDFCDVTIVCEDDQQMEAHRIILAAASSVFKSMFKQTWHPHPVVFLRGMKGKYLTSMMSYIYEGEVTICQGDLEMFLSLAQDFKLKGLEQTEYHQPNQKINNEPNLELGMSSYEKIKHILKADEDIYKDPLVITETKLESLKQTENQQPNPMSILKSNLELEMPTNEKVKIILRAEVNVNKDTIVTAEEKHGNDTKNKSISNGDYLDLQIASIIEQMDKYWICKVCGKSLKSKQDITRHAETHVKDKSFTCDKCPKVSKSRLVMKRHKCKGLNETEESQVKPLTAQTNEDSTNNINTDMSNIIEVESCREKNNFK